MTLRPSAKSRAKAAAKRSEPGRVAWKTEPPNGPCAACGQRGPRVRHHVVYEQHVRREGGDPWDLANAMLLGRFCRCHGDHHAPNGRTPLALKTVPWEAVAFASRLLGHDRAADYFTKHYDRSN